MTETLVSILITPAWLACSMGWASWVAAYAVVTPWRFL